MTTDFLRKHEIDRSNCFGTFSQYYDEWGNLLTELLFLETVNICKIFRFAVYWCFVT